MGAERRNGVSRKALRHLIPANKDDIAAAQAAIAKGYPGVQPIAYDLLKWVRDPSWPVAKPLLEFFAGIGPALVLEVIEILCSRDDHWKAVVLEHLVVGWPSEDIRQLSDPLKMLATHGQSWGADLMALRFLAQHNLGDSEWIAEWLEFKKKHEVKRLKDIDEITRILRGGGAA